MTGTGVLIRDELIRRGIDVASEQVSSAVSYHTFVYGARRHYIVGTVPDISSGTSKQIADCKQLSYRVLSSNENTADYLLPTIDYSSDASAELFLKEHHTIVVKPVDGAHGYGVTTDVDSASRLAIALKAAMDNSATKSVILQKQVWGDEYRLLVIDGELVAVIVREPASVIGDGKHTVKELIDLENRTNKERGELPYSKPLNKISIKAVQSYLSQSELNSVPAARQRVQVVGTSNMGTGGSSREAMNEIPVFLKQLAVQVANQVGAFVCGVDIIADANFEHFWLLEVNASPTFIMHESPVIGKSIPVTSIFIDKLLRAYDGTDADVVGVSSLVDFIGYKNLKQIPARIDTGARTSSLWASDVTIKKGVATFKLFGPDSPWYTGKVVRRKVLELREVTSSTGHVQERYVISLSIRIHGKRLNAKFTLSDRSTQTYPVLIGRNTLRGNFLVDSGDPGEAKLYKYPEEADEFNENEAV